MTDFEGKCVLVTGGTRGIGGASVRVFHDRGACVAVNGTSPEGVNRAIEALGGGPRLVAAPGDVGSAKGCATLVGAAIEALGGLDVLVNNAGINSLTGSSESADEAVWDRLFDVNAKGTFFCSQAALPALRARKGNIVNLGSHSGLMGTPPMTVYCATKGAVVNLTRAMALELAPEVRVNAICPGVVATDMMEEALEAAEDRAALEKAVEEYTPLKTMAGPDEIAEAIVYLASADARFVTGATWQIDGGTTAGP